MPNGPIVSPLRYPGGKASLALPIEEMIKRRYADNQVVYVEPFSGGASIAIYLVKENIVSSSIINDKDRAIYAFWYSILNDTENFLRKMYDTPITYENWIVQKGIHNDKSGFDTLELGFATFFLNRTNRSGIITGGVLGGKNQNGITDIACRFNKLNLSKRIEKIAQLRHRFNLYNLDAGDLIDKVIRDLDRPKLVYYDPPYYKKADRLYENHFTHLDHERLRNSVSSFEHDWIMTYDDCYQIRDLYSSYNIADLTLNYSAHKRRKGNEILIYNDTQLKIL